MVEKLVLEFYTVCFCFPSWGLSKYIETKVQTTWFYLISRFFKNKKRSGTSLPCLVFWIIFEEKYFSCYILLIGQVSLSGFTSWDIEQYVYCNCLLTRLWRHKLWSQSYLSNRAIFSTWPKSHDKNLNILRTERDFKMK